MFEVDSSRRRDATELEELRRGGPLGRVARTQAATARQCRRRPVSARSCASSPARTRRSISTLRVLGNAPDGFHELRTVFQTIELHDTLVCVERPGPFALKCRTPGVPLDEYESGLEGGGGAVDGARPRGRAARRGRHDRQGDSGAGGPRRRQRRRGRGAPRRSRGSGAARRSRCCARSRAGIGADVPFFLSGGTALGLGRGEEIYPLVDLPPHWIVIVRPPFGVSTAEAYAWYDEDRTAGLRGAAGAPDPAGAVADARRADDQRPRAAGRPPAPGDRRARDRAAGGGRDRGGDVRQRLGGVRPVSQPRGGAERRSSRCRRAARGRS